MSFASKLEAKIVNEYNGDVNGSTSKAVQAAIYATIQEAAFRVRDWEDVGCECDECHTIRLITNDIRTMGYDE